MIISIEKKQEELLNGEAQLKTLSTEGSFEEGEYVIIEEIIDPSVTTTVETTRYLTTEDIDREISNRQSQIELLNSELSLWQSLGGTNE